MREKFWKMVVRSQPEGCFLPWWCRLVRAMLFPLDTVYLTLSKSRGYQVESDSWIIGGCKFSHRSLMNLANSSGEVYRVTRKADFIICERIEVPGE